MLNLKNINFTIKKDKEKINLIKEENLKIGKGSFVAVVGPSVWKNYITKDNRWYQ